MSHTPRLILAAAILLSTFSANALDAPSSLIPAGLSPGDTFYAVFATSTQTVATSTTFSDYVTFVNAAASGSAITNGVANWQPIASTAASGNCDYWYTSTASPVYLVNAVPASMEKVADNLADISDNTIDTAIDTFEDGTVSAAATGVLNDLVWTGCDPDMTTTNNWQLGNGTVSVGSVSSTNSQWVGWLGTTPNQNFRMYSVSPLLTVPTPTTVPSSALEW